MGADVILRAWWPVVVLAAVLIGAGVALRLALVSSAGRRARAREVAGAAAQYGLLFGFAVVAAAISAHGLTGFARANMGLSGSWPYLLWAALDGAAGLCAVLLMRRAARGESALAPRLAVWGLVTASSGFNWAHAPHHPGARAAFALMPVIAATLFEFSLRETRHTAGRADRRLPAWTWLHPAERLRAQTQLAIAGHLTAEQATHQVRVNRAARRLYTLRQQITPGSPRARDSRRARRAERLAQAALARAGFADPGIAIEVLCKVQVLALTRTLAQLDYATPDGPSAALANLINAAPATAPASSPAADRSVPSRSEFKKIMHNGHRPQPSATSAPPSLAAPDLNGHTSPAWQPHSAAHSVTAVAAPSCAGPVRGHADKLLVEAAAHVVTEAGARGDQLSQAELARQLRAQGFHIANERLRWLATVSGLGQPAGQRP